MTRMHDRLRAAAAAAVLSAAIVAAPGPLAAQDGPNVDPDAEAAPGPVALVDAALALAELGRDREDPVILLGAARTLQIIGESPGDDPAAGDGAVDAGKASVGLETKPETGAAEDRDPVAEVLADARFFARGDEDILALADGVEAAAARGSTVGPHSHRYRLRARAYIDQVEEYEGGEPAEVLVVGDGDTDVDLLVFDDRDNLVCASETLSDREACVWTPIRAGRFVIRMVNYGGVYNDIVMMTN